LRHQPASAASAQLPTIPNVAAARSESLISLQLVLYSVLSLSEMMPLNAVLLASLLVPQMGNPSLLEVHPLAVQSAHVHGQN
jgi:hypothetical protein